jgi:uncharacterized glyoxalase superfamily protein PhnB
MNSNINDEPNVQQAVPLFSVSNMEESLNFYINGLGFTITNKWIEDGKLLWCWLQLGGAAVMLQEFRKEGKNSWAPKGKPGEGVSINFQCKDAIAIYKEVITRGIQPKKPFVGNGMWVTGISDPDGYRLFFESTTDVPEETEYT